MKNHIEKAGKILKRNLLAYKYFIIALILYMLYFYIFHRGEPNCLIKRSIGLPCPLCGMTRSLLSLATFHIKDALYYHPFIVFMPIIIIVVLFRGYKTIDRLFYSKLFWGILLLILIIIYSIRMILFFPDTAPLDYYKDHLFSFLF